MSISAGPWFSSVNYAIGSVVQYQGPIFVAAAVSLNVPPLPANASWTLVPSGGGGGGTQTLTQSGNTFTLSNAGGSVSVATTTQVAANTKNLTTINYNDVPIIPITEITGDVLVKSGGFSLDSINNISTPGDVISSLADHNYSLNTVGAYIATFPVGPTGPQGPTGAAGSPGYVGYGTFFYDSDVPPYGGGVWNFNGGTLNIQNDTTQQTFLNSLVQLIDTKGSASLTIWQSPSVYLATIATGYTLTSGVYHFTVPMAVGIFWANAPTTFYLYVTPTAGAEGPQGPTGLTGPQGPTGPYGTVQPFSYQFYVSNVSGSDSLGTGQIGNPWKTIGYTLTQLPATQTIPCIIFLAAGTYTENVVVSRANCYLVGGSTSLSTATFINGSITWDATSSALASIIGGVSSIQFLNILYNNASAYDQTLILTDCVILSNAGVSAVKLTDASTGGGFGTINLQNCVVYFIDTIAIDVGGNTSISVVNTQITNYPGTTAGVQLIRTTKQGRVNLFGASLIQNNATSTVLPLIDFQNDTATPTGMNINSCLLTYTSTASDAGTGAKCCIRFSNTAAMGTSAVTPSVNCIFNYMRCEGATTTNGVPTQFVVVQRTTGAAGNVYFNYGSNLCGATANHLSGTSTFIKTPWIALAT